MFKQSQATTIVPSWGNSYFVDHQGVSGVSEVDHYFCIKAHVRYVTF